MIRIEFGSIPEGSLHIDLVGEACDLEVAGDSGTVSFVSPVRLALDIVRSSGGILIRGKAAVDVAVDCVRCLKRYETGLEAALNIMCIFGEAAPDDAEGCRDGVIEIPTNARYVDISGEVRSELMLRLPVKPLCDPACKGLCPSCGADLNGTGCSCKPDEHDSRWDALRELK
jgi:uncharacterized protein